MDEMFVHDSEQTHTKEHDAETLKHPEEELEHDVDPVNTLCHRKSGPHTPRCFE